MILPTNTRLINVKVNCDFWINAYIFILNFKAQTLKWRKPENNSLADNWILFQSKLWDNCQWFYFIFCHDFFMIFSR